MSWWTDSWFAFAPWMFPVFFLLFVALCVLMMRGGFACCGFGHDRRSGGVAEAKWPSEPNRPDRNAAFEEYRADTIRRLHQEQGEFDAFLRRLQTAKDKAEFDRFMAERGMRPGQDFPLDGKIAAASSAPAAAPTS